MLSGFDGWNADCLCVYHFSHSVMANNVDI